MKQLSNAEIENHYKSAAANLQISSDDNAVVFYDSAILQDRLSALSNNFPNQCLHAIAIKTNSSPEVLRYIVSRGHGLEAASFEEVQLAAEAGISADKIVFDSPVKTQKEIDACHHQFPNMVVNANSLEELARYPKKFSGRIGLRINPLVHADSPSLLNVSTSNSKFGVPITWRDKIIQQALQHNITCLHVHIGSGINNFEANIKAVQTIMNLAQEINTERLANDQSNSIDTIDIGGGILFTNEDDLQAYVHELTRLQLFEKYQVITEFGKFVHRDAAFVVSNIEYITPGEREEDCATIFIHVGADLFVRKVYSNLQIQYPFSIIRQMQSVPCDYQQQKFNVAGPLCFAGDFLYQDLLIDEISRDDKFVIQQIGANTLSMWSSHCSRKQPKFIFLS